MAWIFDSTIKNEKGRHNTMEIILSEKKKAAIQPDMIGLFFEDINYSADGGLYAEMIENRSFEFLKSAGDKGDYYTVFDGGYGWSLYPQDTNAEMAVVMGSPLTEENPHYLRFAAQQPGAGFANQAYDGICMKKELTYRVSFYARNVRFQGVYEVSIQKDGKVYAAAQITPATEETKGLKKWMRYEATLQASENVSNALFVISLSQPGTVEFDFISMFPSDAVAGIFRKDLFEKLQGLHPGFIRFPGGCIVEGNTLDNRYRFKDTLKPVEHRKNNWSRWAVYDPFYIKEPRERYSHYNQSLGLGYYEFFLLCELLHAKPLPVLNVGLACQYQSYELVELEDPRFQEFLQDALDLIEFANGSPDTKWGMVRAEMGHPEPFGLSMLGIGNEQWETPKSRFFARYARFEKTIHDKYPDMRLIGSAGPDITSQKYEAAWNFLRDAAKENSHIAYAVDEHYYVEPKWFYEHTDFYDEYARNIKVFSGEYAAHPTVTDFNNPAANTLEGALSEAAFLTGVERNADVVVLASYAPLFARMGFAQWSPDLIWFDGESSYATPSYYVQKLYSDYKGTVTLDTLGQEKTLRQEKIYYNVTMDEQSGTIYLKLVNANESPVNICLRHETGKAITTEKAPAMGGDDDVKSFNNLECPDKIVLKESIDTADASDITINKNSFVVLCMKTA